MDNMTFSDQEIEEELARLGYTNIPQDKLREFQRGERTFLFYVL
jgi:hypothetical protein